MRSAHILAGVLLASTCLLAVPSQAAGLLGGVLGGGSSSSSGNTVSVPGVASVSLNNQSSGTNADATALGGGGSTINVGLSGLIGGNSNASATLPGFGGDDSLDSLIGSTNGVTGNGGTIDDFLTNSGLSGDNGGVGGAIGGNGGLLGDNGNGGGIGGPGQGGTVGGTLVGGSDLFGSGGLGGAGANGNCNQNTRGLAQLLQMKYSRQAFGSWSHASGVQVVPVKVCAQYRKQVNNAAMANAGISAARGIAASDPLISASLTRSRHDAGDVLGIAQRNGMLTVFVY